MVTNSALDPVAAVSLLLALNFGPKARFVRLTLAPNLYTQKTFGIYVLTTTDCKKHGVSYLLTFPTAKSRTSFAPALLPCLVMICTRFKTANTGTISMFNTTIATKNCQLFGFLLLPLIWIHSCDRCR